ncbi:hypothetical protein COLO4_00323 [Corchorus olitorius]|uniref:Uncharacterized protein n=1 Tax=Corchorus olitorius TaxID=93759 RepID=A0A1R3L408_9ROSI|nr:hypothetical protein COLO4_00323 [Corchorus olitorius]
MGLSVENSPPYITMSLRLFPSLCGFFLIEGLGFPINSIIGFRVKLGLKLEVLAFENSTEFSSNSLAIASNIINIMLHFQASVHKKLLKIDNNLGHVSDSGFPNWVRSRHWRLLQEENPKPDLTVA